MLCHVRWVGSGRPARGPVARRHMRRALVERVGPASNRHMTTLPHAAARLIGGGSHHSGWYLNISNFNKSVGSVNKRNVLIYKPLGVRGVDVQAWVNALFHRDKVSNKSLIMRYKTQLFFLFRNDLSSCLSPQTIRRAKTSGVPKAFFGGVRSVLFLQTVGGFGHHPPANACRFLWGAPLARRDWSFRCHVFWLKSCVAILTEPAIEKAVFARFHCGK